MGTKSEALEIQREVDIVLHQELGLVCSETVKSVINELESRAYDNFLIKIEAFNYGYIMGKRAERARRKGGEA